MKKVKVMGILNVTPDSFSDGGLYLNLEKAVAHALNMEKQGADIIDIGGESTRPGAESVPLKEEMSRVLPIIQELKKVLTIPISIDTMKPEVARACLKAGASMINDVSGFRDPDMVKVALDFDVPICCMHMLGNPKTMQNAPYYKEGIINHLIAWTEERISYLTDSGIKKSNIIIDPGLGFGKTVADNLEIIHNLPKLVQVGCSVLVGASKKSFTVRVAEMLPKKFKSASVEIHILAVLGGASYIRVHDVEEHLQALARIGQE